MSSPSGMDDYLARIERHFGLRRGGRLLLSPRDWQLVAGWHERGVPLPVVLRGINRAFDRFEANRRSDRINSLSYCAQQVDEVWEEERERAAEEGNAARGDGGALEGPAERLRASAEACAAAAQGADRADGPAELLRQTASELALLADRLTSGDAGAREVDARCLELEGELREVCPELFEKSAVPDGAPGLEPFSPWSV